MAGRKTVQFYEFFGFYEETLLKLWSFFGFVRCIVKCTLVQALRLCTGRAAHRGSRGIALPFLDHGTRRGWGFSVTPRPLFTLRKDPVPIVQEAGWAPGPVWTGAENLALTGIRSPDRPARNQSLYRLSYQVHYNKSMFRHFRGKYCIHFQSDRFPDGCWSDC